MSETSDDDNILTPEELKKQVANAELSLLPEKSREKYLKAYNVFDKWRVAKGANTFSQTVLLSYFVGLSETKQCSTLWSIYSMLKATIKLKHNVHIETYPKLIAYIKRMSVGHKAKKSKTLTAPEIEEFLNEAPDCSFLAAKVILIIGISGACRNNELLNLTIKDIEKRSETVLIVKLNNTKTSIDRTFVLHRAEYVNIVQKYQNLRPDNMKTDRFFIQYHNNKCSRQPMGINKIGAVPREIATYLGLDEPQLYTGHCLRRTSATLLADSGADLMTIKRHGGWKSNTVAEGYVEDSIENKTKICNRIVETIRLKQTTDPWSHPRPCTSKESDPLSHPRPCTSNESDPWSHPRPSTSKQSDPWSQPRPSTSKEPDSWPHRRPSTAEDMDPWSPARPSIAKDAQCTYTESRCESPTFTLVPSQAANETEILSSDHRQLTATIEMPNKMINLSNLNCYNCTFNF